MRQNIEIDALKARALTPEAIRARLTDDVMDQLCGRVRREHKIMRDIVVRALTEGKS